MRTIALVVALLATTPAFAAQPAFNCERAFKATEQLLCTNERMAMLDQQNAILFYKVRAMIPQGVLKYFNAAERDWIADRNSCGWNVQCVEASYTKHQETLCSYVHWGADGCEGE